MIPEAHYVEIGDGLKVHYHAEGEGPPVVFLHGSGPGASGWSNFRRNYPAFARAGFRALVPDTLGFGYSSKPDVDYTMDFVVGGLTRFLDVMGIDRCAVVGNSHGGATAIQLALVAPARVEKLILMAPGGLEEREVYMKMPGIRAMMKAFLGGAPLSRETLRPVFELQLYDKALVTDEILDERLHIAKLQPKRVMASMQVPHLAPRLAELKCPIFALWGMNDQFCPVSGAKRIAEACSRTRVLTLSECGHWVMVEHAELFNRLCVDFLRER
jgi:4,5:9,10-diseco-3-hydroxy-5,9,17-trioxoandrosta-1(10),2-diene-4-oate hydrolase